MTDMSLKEALQILIRDECLSDWIYDVRSNAVENSDGYEGDSWEHPRVKKFAEACERLEQELNALEAQP